VEETYVNRVVIGQTLPVSLVTGETIEGKVIFVAPEAEFATQRDVNRAKRDIRTFGIKVALANAERRLHPGMTAHVLLSDAVPTVTERESPPARSGASDARQSATRPR
jgi:hypothetical protein